MTAPLVSIRGLRVAFGAVQAVDGVDLELGRGEVVALIGESGSGKSVTLRALLRLNPERRTRIEGSIIVDGRDVMAMGRRELAQYRGGVASMIFQEPLLALDPVYTLGQQIVESIRRHESVGAAAARARALALFERVRIPSPERRLDAYPHEMSGGMRQRVMIAMALANDPQLLIADEPTTALDVTIQAQILTLIRRLQEETGTAMILITHDLGVVAEVADEVAVMYAGRVVESGPVDAIFEDPQHPYTIGLMGSVPSLGRRQGRLATIRGTVPPAELMPKGCRFTPRCPFSDSHCANDPPPLAEIKPGHRARCWYAPLELHRGADL
ncbi:MAG: ABC transporter ATP-binding protein [Microvirga sp.]